VELGPTDIRAIGAYIARKTGLHDDRLADAVADGLLALVERGGVDTMRDAKWFAYVGAVDAHRKRMGRSTHPNAPGIRNPEPLPEVEGHTHGRWDQYPSDSDVPRILTWAKREPEQTRWIIYYVLQGFTFQDAATLVGVSPSRASQRLHKKGRP
jgi:DNA-directed RNA polymerase specialized sigma24 family protein